MKSNRAQLSRRGMINEKELAPLKSLSDDELLMFLTSSLSTERTAAVYLLKKLSSTTVDHLLTQLAIEKALYTRLAICQKLAEGEEAVVEKMTGYLGCIGNNHYSVPPTKPSKKQSYPLPRDLIARTFGKMSPTISPQLFGAVQRVGRTQLSELIDAIGFMVFYHSELVTTINFRTIEQLLMENRGDPLIEWKLLTCLSAFPQSDRLLTSYAELPGILGLEAKRSLYLLDRNC